MNDSNDNYNNGNEDRMHSWGRDARKPRYTHGGVYAGHSPHGHVVLGIIALLLGILFLLENLGFFDVAQVWQFWPVILIAVGVAHILDARDLGSTVWGAVLAGVGAVFLANTLGYLPWYLWRLLWPVLLIGAGITILLSGFGRQLWAAPHSFVHSASTNSDNVLKEVAVFGGINRRIEAQDFQGGEATAVFGGVELDLRRASTTRDEIEIVVSAVFGGVELFLPDTWDVTVRGAGILGGFEDKTHPAPVPGSGKRPRLVIRGSAVFGGVTVRN